MFGKRKSELQKLREDYDKIVELLTRQTKRLELLCKSDSNSEPKQPEVTARQIINEWYHFEEERVKNNGRIE